MTIFEYANLPENRDGFFTEKLFGGKYYVVRHRGFCSGLIPCLGSAPISGARSISTAKQDLRDHCQRDIAKKSYYSAPFSKTFDYPITYPFEPIILGAN